MYYDLKPKRSKWLLLNTSSDDYPNVLDNPLNENLKLLSLWIRNKTILEALLKCKDLIHDDDSPVIDFEAGTIVSENEALFIEDQKYTVVFILD
jgi:hypothetical protein